MPWRTLKHFKLSITGKPSQLFDETNIDWAPSQNLGYKEVTKVTMDRYDRAVWREKNKRRRIEAEVCETMTATATTTARATQTVLTGIEVALDKNLNFLYFTKYRLCIGHSTFGCPLHVIYMIGEIF